MRLDGSVAVVIGGAKGMGKCYCQALLQSGVKVLLGDIQVQAGEETQQELTVQFGPNIIFRKCNGASEDDIRATLLEAKQHWGKLDIVVNHVGILNETEWQRMLEINVGSAILTARVTEEILGKNNGGPGGVLVHTASRGGVIPSPLMPVYAATKAAMIHYTRSLMHPVQYKRHGIRMMCVCPGMTKTDFILEAHSRGKVALYEETLAAFKTREDTKTWVYPEWVGELLITMLKDDKEMAGVAAVLNSRTPEYFHKGEWSNIK